MKSTILAIFIPIIILFSRCKRHDLCDGTSPDYYFHLKLGDSTLSKMPHTGLDTLIFYNQYGDTVFLKGIGTETLTSVYNIHQDPNCGYSEHYSYDYKTLHYEQDPTLSNTSKEFPIKTIEIDADSNDSYTISERNGGYSISFYTLFAQRVYFFLNDKYYTQNISIGNQNYNCVPFVGLPNGNSLYFNHYHGIVQVIESDTVIWNRNF
jgi:hypothetical protein